MKTYKKTILIDLDGVLNTYNGKYDETQIPPIREGAVDFIKQLAESFKIILFTSRNLLLASQWVLENNLKDYIFNVTNIKEPSYLLIDDRCLNFKGDYTKILDEISNFSVWYK